VWKLSLDGGASCPNVDGTLGRGGCVFCNVASYSPSRRGKPQSIRRQIDEGLQKIRRRYGASVVIAYFQPGTNTYAPVEKLQEVWEEAVAHDQVVGLAVGTRPDCVPDEVLDLLAELARQTWVIVEYGLQTIHDRTLDWINRHHHFDAFVDAVQRTRQRGLTVGAHVILGLPGETLADMVATATQLGRLGLHAVKLHNLYAVRHTPLADMVAAGTVRLQSREEYVDCAVSFLEHLPPDCVIDRLSGDAPPEYLVAPPWCLNRAAVRRAIETELRRRNTWQGRRWTPSA